MFELVVVPKVLRSPMSAILQLCDAGDIACLLEVHTSMNISNSCHVIGASRRINDRFADEVLE